MKILVMLLAPATLLAQNATLSGLVRDATQSAIPEASLTVTQVETGTERSVKSSTAGMYALPALIPGHYKITVEAKGFQVKTVENVELQPEQNARLDFTLDGAAAEIHGRVIDAHGGEALEGIQIQLAGTPYRVTSDASGRFHIGGIPPGDYVFNVSTVGYHMEKHAVHLDAGSSTDFSVILTPDTLRQTQTVDEKADPFDTARGDSPDVVTLAGTDAKNLGSVLADDPLRAVQGLPGVTSDRDFEARFSLRGAGFDRIGLYLDGILLHEPFHLAAAGNQDGSVTAFNPDLVEEMDLHKSAWPVRFEDRTVGILDVETRDGSRNNTLFRGTASLTDAGFMAEGPLGPRRKAKGSWVVAVRKSYLQYLLNRLSTSSIPTFDMEDVQARLAYDFTPKNTVTFSLLESYSHLDQSNRLDRLSVNGILKSAYHYTLTNLSWRYSPTPKVLFVNRAAWMREKHDDINPAQLPLGGGFYGEWVGDSTVTWTWSNQAPFEAGISIRRLRDRSYSNSYQTASSTPFNIDHADGTALQTGGYVQQSWAGWSGRLRLTAGARWDNHSIDHVSVVSPQASASLGITRTTRLQLGWSDTAQFPEISVFRSVFGNTALLPERSVHSVAALEQRLGPRTRLRAELYQRTDRDLPSQPFFDPRILNGAIFIPPSNPLYYNSLRGHSRGAEIFLQRSTANRLTGWISYAYGHTVMHEGITGLQYPSDYDQRHTVNAYGGLRIRPTVNLSLRVTYGSGFPIPGFFARLPSGYYVLAPELNQLRIPAYQRTDLRINKSWMHDKWKFTLYGEIINLTRHSNYFFQNANYNFQTGQASPNLSNGFPLLPSVGVMVEW
ncbi:TonB-dependent receptor [Candidatus Sulfopaludibacter sp. SbA3]|nr:TonB-dependent receptor [Candidatus Sulfopaludibacter sp. SbA3]